MPPDMPFSLLSYEMLWIYLKIIDIKITTKKLIKFMGEKKKLIKGTLMLI